MQKILWLFIIPFSLLAKPDLNQSIAIVGSGISGLTAGHYLKKLGYKNVTIFEKENHIGGKIYSQRINGSLYELGAVWIFRDYHTLLELVREYKIKLKRFPAHKSILTNEGKRLSFLDYGLKRSNFLELIDSLLRTKELLEKYDYLKKPGFEEIPYELTLNFQDFVKKHHLEALASLMEPFIIGTGYGYFPEVPAIYYLKPTILVLNSLIEDILGEENQNNVFQFFPEGFSHFLQKMAEKMEIKLNQEVLKIIRRDGKVFIRTNEGLSNFDKVIISTPPPDILKFLDTTDEEFLLLANFKFNRYQITAFSGQDIPKQEVIFLEKALWEKGVPGVLANWGSNNEIYLALTPYKGQIPVTLLEKKMEREIENLGGMITEIIFRKNISYFYYFNSDFLRQPNVYKRLNLMQGHLGTYFIGSYLNFESVEHSAQFSKDLVLRYFK